MLKKFGEKITKKGLLIAGGIAIALVAIIIAIAIVSSKGEKTKKNSSTPDSELARAMTYDQFTDADSSVDGTDYVKFGAFFLRDINNDGYAEKIKGTCKQVGKEDTLYMELNVLTNGYLENGVITINSDNFYLQTAIPKDSEVKDNVISNNTKQISLNQINNGTQKLLTGIVRTGDYSQDSQKFAAIGNDTTKMSKVNSVTLTGTHVAADGTRTQINKTVEFNMDWYGTTKTEIPNYIDGEPNLNQSKDNTDIIDEENNQVVFEFDIGIQELNNELILSKACIEGEVPQLNGYDPITVDAGNSNAQIAYDNSTRKFVISKFTELDENGVVKKQCYDNSYYEKRYNKFKVRVIYPLEAYNITGADAVELKIPISAYYEGYNNENSEFTTPYRSEPANGTIVLTYKKPNGDVAIFDVRVGEWTYVDSTKYIVSKRKPLNIYNGVSATEKNDTYEVLWKAETGNGGQSKGITMKETKDGETQISDEFIKADSSTESMSELTTNIGIYFRNANDMLGENGWIKVYNDETNELIHEFNKDDWNNYSKEVPYKYQMEVKHIRIVTSTTEKNKSLYVYNVKSLDDEYITNNYSRAEFDNLKYIKSTLTGYIDENFVNTDTNQAFYETPYSLARISVNKEAISTQETEKNLEINIRTAKEEKYNQEAWKNGIFLIKLPEDIIDAEINDVEISRDDVNIISKEIYTDENGDKYIKIITENDEAVFFDIVIKCTVSADPRILTKTENVELYAYNEDASDYYKSSEDIYDINGNLNTTEIVNKTSAELILMSPNSLLTNQVAVNYDNNGSVAIAPQIAIVSKEKRSATIDVEINNNYSSTISDVVIIGRTPFKDNKYTLSKTDMGSTFTATMTNDGITLPDELKNTAIVYYSENGEATKNLSDKSNGWTKTPADFTKVKSYLVDFSNHKFNKGERYIISYNINIPDGLNYNQVSYSHHAVYFSLDTAEGKYKTQTEPNKVGLMIAKQYDLDGIKYQIGKDKKISGTTYAVYEDGSEDIKTRFTNADGKFTLSGLFVDRTYVIKEIKSPDDYELNEEVVKFTTSESDGKISVTKVEGNVKNISVIDSTEKVQVQLEDEVRAKLKISKIDKDTSVGLKNVKYKITGKGIDNSGKILTTDSNGEILLAGLYIGEEYTLEEIKADGYYLPDGAIKFVINNNGTYAVNVIDGNVKETQIIEDNDIPIVNLKVENEKIPTYNLEINKVVKGETTPLSNVKFAIESKDSGKIAYYTTDGTGKINIQGLYQYKNDKSNTAEYILKEITTPEGYSSMKDVTFRVENNNGNLQVNVLSGDVKETSSNGTNVKIVVENAPIFILTKRDKDTNELIPNTKFKVYNLNDNDFAKDIYGNYIGTHEKYSGLPLENIGDYDWEKNEDGTLVSGNYNIDNSKSTLKADFEIMEKGKIDFDWSVSSESPNYDYLYVEVKNLVDDSQVHYDKIEGTTYGAEYSELQFTHKTIELEPGKYSIEITYSKDPAVNDGLDAGFLRNIKISEDVYAPYYYVETDENGKINLKLQSGLYKAVEYESNEMYQLPEDEKDRTYYFGIDETKDEEKGVMVDGYLLEEKSSIAYVKCISKTSDGGYVLCIDFKRKIKITDDVIFESETYDGYDTAIVKYNENDEVEWAKHISAMADVVTNKAIQTSDDGIVVIGGTTAKKVNIADEQIFTQNNAYEMGFILKYNNNGDLLWSSKTELELVSSSTGGSMGGGATYLGIRKVIETSDGNYVTSTGYGNSKDTYKMKLQNGTELNSYGKGDIALIKFSQDGQIISAYSIGGKYGDSCDFLISTSDGGYFIGVYSSDDKSTEINVMGSTIKYGPKVGYSKKLTIEIDKDDNVKRHIVNSKNEDFYKLNENGYLISGNSDTTKGYLKKYDSENNLEWEKNFDASIWNVFEGFDNGYFVTSDDTLYLLAENGEIKYTHSFNFLSGKILDGVLIEKDKFIAVGSLWSATVELSNKKTLESKTINGLILKYSQETLNDKINSMKQLTVYNEKKKYNITTKVDGNIGGSITGEGENPFETVLYNENSVKDIIMKPDEGYQIEKVTVNGEIYDVIDNQDGTYTIPKFENMLEDKEIIVKYANKESYLEINKTDEKNGEAISGVEFNVQQEYTGDELKNVLGKLKNDNGTDGIKDYIGSEVNTGEQLALEENGDYYFVKNSDGVYIPTNSKTYQTENGGTTGIQSSTANSYITIDLSNMTGSYLVKVNASCSSELYHDYGYATITESTIAPTYSTSDGRFVYLSGMQSSKDYTSTILEGGKKYYLHLGYKKDSSQDKNDDQVVFNSVKVLQLETSECGEPVKNSDYEFVKTSSGTYIPTNGKKYQESIGNASGIQSSRAESVIEIDLTNITGDYVIRVTANASTEKNQDYGYAMLTKDTEIIKNVSKGFIYVSGNVNSRTYFSNGITGGNKYYLHLGYKKDSSTDSGDDSIEFEKINLYKIDAIEKGMSENDGKYMVNANLGSYSVAHSYIPLDLTKYNGEYLLKIQAETNFKSGEAYIHLANDTTILESYNTSGRIIYLQKAAENTEYVAKVQGGKVYYIQIGCKSYNTTVGNEFIINSIKVYQNPDNLYNQVVKTDENGKAIISLGIGKYTIKETQAADGYELNTQPVEVNIDQAKKYSVNITNKQMAKLIVHHYIKGTTTKLADDENAEAHAGDSYITNPKLDLDKYELERDSNGAFVLPANAVGTYKTGTTEVTYYYVEKQIPLTVHHYIEGTTEKVPLKAGGIASDVTGSGKEGESYTTSAIANDKLSDEYELVEMPSNASGTYSGNEVVVTYYYKKVVRDVNLVKYKEDGKTPLAGAKFRIEGNEYTTDTNGKIQVKLEAGIHDITEIEAPEGYKLPENPTTKVTISKATPETVNITNEKKTGTVTVHHYIEGTTTKVPLADGGTADDEVKTGNVGDIYATKIVDNLSEGYELSLEPNNGSGTYIDGNIEVIYYYKSIPTSVLVHHYLEGTTTKLADDVIHDGIVGDNYTTGVAPVDSKYEVVAIPANANGKMTREQIVVIYYYRVKDTSVLVHHYKEGTSESLSKDVTITGKVDDAYMTSVASDIPSKYELVATPTNASGKMTVAQTVVTYYYRLKSTGVDVHYYKEGTTEKVSKDVAIEGKVDQTYTTTPATDVESKYELVGTPANATGTMTESRITVIYYYRLKDTSVLVHHYLEGTTTKLADDVTINGQVDDTYKTVANTDLLAGKYELVAEPTNKSGTMTEAQIVVIYYYRVKDTSVLVHHYIKGTTTSLSKDVTIKGKIDDKYTTTKADDIPEQYELVAEPTNKSGAMTEEQIVVTYYYQLKNYPYTVNYLEKGTNNVLHDAKQGGALTYGSTVKASDEKIDINGYKFDSYDKETLTIGITGNVINIYYTKRNDLSYKVNYLEKGTNKVLHEQKVQGGMTFDSEVTASDEVIDIDGYNYDSVDKTTLKITPGENVINIYYTKRNDLSYTVNYLEKDTNKVLHNPKNQTGMTFGDIITSSNEIIDIDGYDYNSVDKNSISIGTSENIINIYYTKRTDLSYKVNYLEKTTNKVLHDQKVKGGMTFESVVDSSKEVIDIDGYNYDSVDKATLKITTGENVINIYYTKRTDLSYTVNYLEKTTNKVLHNPKTVENKTFGDVIKSADEKISIDGYNYDSVDKDTLTITTRENVINIYYTKRTNLSYKVNYLEKDTNKVLHDQKTQNGMTFEATVISRDEVIDINGYNFNSVDKETLIIGTGENVINIYYTKRTDLSYKVNYLEKTTNKVLHDQKEQGGMTFEAEVKSADEVIDINGYKYDSADKESIKITTGENVINIYYTKVTGLSYTVNYLEKGTNEVINPAKTQDGMTFEDVVTSRDEIISIDGYNYNSVDKDTLIIGTGENVINIYYTKRTDLSYKVNYLEKGTNKVLHDQKVQENMTFKATVKSSNEVIDIDGYDYDSVDKEILTIGTGENVINIYYTKRTDLIYKVNYLEKDTNKVLHNPKVQDGMTFEGTVKSSDEVIDIDGYNYDSVDKATLTITTGENVINIYYTKRTDLSYKVNYLEKTTNKVLHNQKVQDGMTFESVVTSTNEVIDIDGYNYDSVDKDTLTITTGENVINIYYTKRNDLSYTVNYLEKDTNIVLHEPKVTENMVFETVIESSKEVIDIDGYNYDSVDKSTLVIGTGKNVINVYYTKRNDLSYTVNYLEKGTNRTIHAPKVTQNMTFGTEITSSKEVIVINGYSYDSVDKDSLIITTGENVINIYYTKVSGLSYTVNYLEKDTEKVLHAPKTTGKMTFEDEVVSSDEVIDIDGYNYDSVDKDKLVIGTGENVINIYYTKRTDLSYKVNYLEKDTNKVLHDQKIQDGMTFESVVTSANEVIDIDGYNYDSVDKETLTITTKENVINIYYTKRTDLSYKVNYLEKDTNKVLHNQKVQNGMTFESVVNSADEVIDIYGYNYDSVDKETLTITTGENVINIYYTKKDTKVTVHYYEEGTTNKVSEDVEIPGKVFDNYETESASDIPSKYELVAEPENKNGTMTEDEITVIYYYRKKVTQVIVHYYEENTTKKLSEDVTINGRVDDPYTTVSADDIPIKYELVAEPVNKSGSMTEATIEVIYYYRVKDAVVHVRYLEKGTDIVLADPDRLDGKVDEDYQTTPKEIDGYQLVEHTGNEKGKFEVEPLTITYYYLYKTKATVQYIDKITGEILDQSTTEGLEGDDFVTESKDFENYVLVEEPPEKTVKMTKEEQVLKYYYIHISGGVIEKHIDIISNEILANAAYEGNEGDEYDIPSRTFDGYDLVEDKLPENAKGTMKVEPVEVIYYYIYRSKVTAEYIDKNTGEKLTDDVTQKGHDGDNYTTERKTFDDYKLVEVPANADGSMTKDDITVTYYYVHTSGGVIVNHIDIKTGKQLLDETKEEGYEGDPYETHEENIPEYDLVKEKYPENAVGKMTIEPTRVTYYYIKKTEVNIKYVDKETGEEIDEPTNIPGHEGDDYTTEPKDVPGYDLIEEPENKDGTMTADPIDVIYYYKRPAKVIVNYYDIDTKEKLADEIEITGYQNDDYTTEQKDIKYYEIAKIPENKEGKMTVTVTKDENDEEIVDNTTYVDYYYRKLIFNLRVDKTIASVIVNGQETVINGTLGKVEVHRKNISNANVKVVYKIKVTNDSELTGKANVVENIPSGMTMLSENNPDWTIKETTASLETDEIKPGESREYQVVLGWQNGDSNVGTKTNMVSITTENEADFDEQFETDNVSNADLIVAVGTGEVPYAKIAGGILLIMISITAGVYVISKKRQ